ncbi:MULTISPECIES: hypothetical protein [Mycobacterium]|uniref:Uncharacterized protein n=2 Tax=Mycobacterium kiyosense TaxID=2871094 RepID=A0A9P3Q735_9MYCO|nr:MULTISPECIES: hypothetical protein [Mycobacterium]BDB39874.1 hypothetical protein IWGMT90018_03200 [Mycobacterium kiyosense]BDE11725.1 hypothetical protein MKCMC460_05850 [Mycobacterium sp. 20KCMC460]GLB85042.1 hypothetical protein SRL2020028_42980 [Mycobacterium kiyosense]GLB88036.1 hypothetical protein SRL2020130_08530 [Mycobacterium kiyosense]GLB95406.1 hypothetical protein SRL2020226_21820 [Mycobacterium kiyosense]
MTTMTTTQMSVAIAPRVLPLPRRSVRRRLTDSLHAALNMTAQQRADAYVARMPISVIAK